MNFREVLPENCPSNGAKIKPLSEAYRLVPSEVVKEKDFDSYAALGKLSKFASLCRLASCSMYTKKASAISVKKLYRLKYSHIAKLNVPDHSGYSLSGKNDHVDFWMFSTFKPLNSIVVVEPIL